ncbi:MAG TPA: hypothetical protein VLL07_07120 [Pontiella sp.]|nr:hypothetical protein [Pontiella sp.]
MRRYDVRNDAFDHNGIPDSRFLVGGGYFIIYRADVEGELFLVEEVSERLLATVSLQSGEDHEMVYDIRDEKLAANLDALGIDPKTAKFKLFFVPRR